MTADRDKIDKVVRIIAEGRAWGDAALPLCMPGPGLGGPPVRGSGSASPCFSSGLVKPLPAPGQRRRTSCGRATTAEQAA